MTASWELHPPVVGMDTGSFGFHVVSSRPILMPGYESTEDALGVTGWSRSTSKDSYDRLRIAHHAALEWFATLPRGSSVWCEEAIVMMKNPETTRKLVMMTGVLYAAFMEAKPDATWFWVNVSTWRREVLNPAKGEAPRKSEDWKALARQHVTAGWPEAPEDATFEEREEHGVRMHAILSAWDAQPDLWDAACLAEYGMKQLAEGKVKLP